MSAMISTLGVGSRWRTSALLATATVALLALLAAFAVILTGDERAAKRDLMERFQARTTLTARFTESYMADFASRERSQASRLLAGPSTPQATFDEVVQAFGLQAAVLLDDAGRVLQVWPARPDLIGTVLAPRYDNLRAAEAGHVAVSNVVPSAATAEPITAVAVPYDTVAGRRVFSGAFGVGATPLGTYFSAASPIAGTRTYLLDAHDQVLAAGATGDPTASVAPPDPTLMQLLRTQSSGITRAAGRTLFYVSEPVAGTPWRVVFTAPTAELLAPLHRVTWAPWAVWGALAVAGAMTVVLLGRVAASRERMADAARTDALTGLPNRRSMEERFTVAAASARRRAQPLAVLLVDLDRFKAVNDTHGHATGDQVLAAVGVAMRTVLRAEDTAGRWGGEEFLVLLPQTDAPGAVRVAQRLRAAVAAAEAGPVGVTASIGLAVGCDREPQALFAHADRALYQAKALGRDRVVVASDPAHPEDGPDIHPGWLDQTGATRPRTGPRGLWERRRHSAFTAISGPSPSLGMPGSG